jgi:hypothetical protein
MKIYTALFLLLFNMVVLSSCGAVETIFKAGMWWAFFLVGLIIVVILIVVSKVRKK